MKTLIFTFALIAATLDSWAQFSITPFGSSGKISPPVGQNRKSSCMGDSCSFELNLKPFCFGTNLRAYNEENQLNPGQLVNLHLTVKHPDSDSKVDNFHVMFPADLTYASSGIRTECIFKEGQDLTVPGEKDISCSMPWLGGTYEYRLKGWLINKNPAYNEYYVGDFSIYAGASLPAIKLTGGSKVDPNINCFYKFNQEGKEGTLLRSSVSCYFPSQLPDRKSEVRVFKDGHELKDLEMIATTNNIRIRFRTDMNSARSDKVIRHGKITATRPPRHSTAFIQEGRNLAAIRETESFDETTGFKSFTLQAKFPGMQGFCGGFYSPLMLFFDRKLPQFSGISLFPLYGVKKGTRIHWPEANSPGYFLTRLLPGEKAIIRAEQLFGKNDRHDNGFLVLAEHDLNADRVIDAKDEIFNQLHLWNDKNGNGQSEADEISTLKENGVTSISLNYRSRDVTKFENRALAKEKSTFQYMKNAKTQTADIFDVWLAPIK